VHVDAPVPSAVETPAPSVPISPSSSREHVISNRRSVKPAVPPASCDPPFIVDSAGIKHYNRECLIHSKPAGS
jgi:hypothetical protein